MSEVVVGSTKLRDCCLVLYFIRRSVNPEASSSIDVRIPISSSSWSRCIPGAINHCHQIFARRWKNSDGC